MAEVAPPTVVEASRGVEDGAVDGNAGADRAPREVTVVLRDRHEFHNPIPLIVYSFQPALWFPLDPLSEADRAEAAAVLAGERDVDPARTGPHWDVLRLRAARRQEGVRPAHPEASAYADEALALAERLASEGDARWASVASLYGAYALDTAQRSMVDVALHIAQTAPDPLVGEAGFQLLTGLGDVELLAPEQLAPFESLSQTFPPSLFAELLLMRSALEAGDEATFARALARYDAACTDDIREILCGPVVQEAMLHLEALQDQGGGLAAEVLRCHWRHVGRALTLAHPGPVPSGAFEACCGEALAKEDGPRVLTIRE